MFPKKIHYCWFGGGPKDKLFEKCYKSWQKYFPDWEIIEWNEDNFDVNFCEYTKRAYELGKYAFVSDVARLKIIYDDGGVYFDTDVEVIKKFDNKFLSEGYFGEEEDGLINTGIGFAALKHNDAIKTILDAYENLSNIQSIVVEIADRYGYNINTQSLLKIDEPQPEFPCPLLNTAALINAGYKVKSGERIAGIPIYEPEYFCGFDYRNHCLSVTNKTYSIHHYNASWMDPEQRRRERIKRRITDVISPNVYRRLKYIKNKLISSND